MDHGPSCGRGVALILKENVAYELLNDFCITPEDCEAVAFITNGAIFAIFYLQLFGNLSNFFAFPESIFLLCKYYYNIVCIGDSNINMLADM